MSLLVRRKNPPSPRRPAPSKASETEKQDNDRAPASGGSGQDALTLIYPHTAYKHTAHVAQRLLHCDDLAVEVLAEGQPIPRRRQPVVVAPSTAHGIAMAARMTAAWHTHLPTPMLLVVRDAPLPAPRIVAHRCRAMESRVLGVVELPYLAVLREVDDPRECLDPTSRKRLSRALARIQRVRGALARLMESDDDKAAR